MTKEELKQANDALLKFYDKALEIVELLSPLNQEQLKYIKLTYDNVKNQVEIERLKGGNKE